MPLAHRDYDRRPGIAHRSQPTTSAGRRGRSSAGACRCTSTARAAHNRKPRGTDNEPRTFPASPTVLGAGICPPAGPAPNRWAKEVASEPRPARQPTALRTLADLPRANPLFPPAAPTLLRSSRTRGSLATMATVRLVPDTMVLIEYAWLEEYPWQDHPQLSGNHVTLVICRPVLEELDKHKDTHPRAAVRRRCLRVLRRIRDVSNAPDQQLTISPDLTIALVMAEPLETVDKRPDDRIVGVASALQALLVSADFTPQILAQTEGVQSFPPLENSRVKHPEDTESEALAKKLQAYEQRSPKLQAKSEGGKPSYGISALPMSLEEFVASTLESFAHKYPTRQGGSDAALPAAAASRGYPQFEVATFMENLKSGAATNYSLAASIAASPVIGLSLHNDGLAAATQIEVAITAPRHSLITPLDSFHFEPLPNRPTRFGDEPAFPYDPRQTTLLHEIAATIRNQNGNHGLLDTDDNQAVYRLARLSQGKIHALDPFIVQVPEPTAPPGIGITFDITCQESPWPVTGNLLATLREPDRGDDERMAWVWRTLMHHYEMDTAN